MDTAEREHIQRFLENTKKRLTELEKKRAPSRAEEIELNMCKGDIKRAEAALAVKD